MRVAVASEAGSPTVPSEDAAVVGPKLFVILDGLTQRTDSGCIHGVPWFVDSLGGAILGHAELSPMDALAAAIAQTADLHRDSCDLQHPGTPAAAVGIVKFDSDSIKYLALGDISIVIDSGKAQTVISDHRISMNSLAERKLAAELPLGSPEKQAALVRMKNAELAVRNTPDGYWIAAANPEAATHGISGTLPLGSVLRIAMLTDGAARAVDLFGLCDWPYALDLMASNGPSALISEVRAAEVSDAEGKRWPRNKLSDDATVIYCDGFAGLS